MLKVLRSSLDSISLACLLFAFPPLLNAQDEVRMIPPDGDVAKYWPHLDGRWYWRTDSHLLCIGKKE